MKSNSTIEERAVAHLNGRKPIIESFASQEKLSNDAKRSILFHCYKDYYDGATDEAKIYAHEMDFMSKRIAELEAIVELTASVMGIGTKWFNDAVKMSATLELREKIMKYYE